jgi:hypothetical protein
MGTSSPITKNLNLAARGVARLDVGELFDLFEVSTPCYLVAKANYPICGFEFVRANGDLLGLSARPFSELMNTLLFPQMAVLGGIKTELTVINYTEEAVILTITAFQANGEPFGEAELQTNPTGSQDENQQAPKGGENGSGVWCVEFGA